MKPSVLNAIADHGQAESIKFDQVTASLIKRIQCMFNRDLGCWIDKSYITRTAIREYMRHLKLPDTKVLDEVEALMGAIEGRPAQGEEVY